jgi:beta-lactamase regulating signal transducer with metallopeptidase domain
VSGLVAAGATAKGVVSLLAMLAVQGTVLAILALVLVKVARSRPAFGAGVWLVVLAKFAVPWSPAMPWSLSDIVAWLRHEDVAAIATAPIGVGGTEAAVSIYPAVGWLLLASMWALGTLYVLTRALLAHRSTLAAARRAVDAPADARALLATLAAALRVRAPRLAVGGAETGPHVVGLVRTTIVVPPALLEDHALLRAALLHELAHVRRKDALARLLQIWATAVFFWWPVVRLVGRRLDLSREAACDAWALEASALPRPAYARLLVKMAALRTAAAPALAAPHALDARVAAVLGPPARARTGIVGKAVIVGWAVMALGGARSAAARGETDVCVYTPQLAEALFQAHPEADLDGDGTLSVTEACELQAEWRRRDPQVSTVAQVAELELDEFLSGPLCCNCGSPDVLFPPSEPPLGAACHKAEGVDR